MAEENNDLKFEDDPGASRSFWIASAITVAALLWMGSGFVFPAGQDKTTSGTDTRTQAPLVATRMSSAETITLYFQGEGQAQPDRETVILAETSGDVAEVYVKKGADVVAGEVLARLSTTQLTAELDRAREDLDRAQREFDNAETLLDRGVATVDRVSSARAALAAAQAQKTGAEQALDAARIEAPFDGRIERFSLDKGEYVTAGSDVGRIVDIQPLTVSLQVPQQMLQGLRRAKTAEVTFITGATRSGEVVFVGSAASADTRTFLTEVVVPNDGGQIPSGVSAEIKIPIGEERAHLISPSVVSLDENGQIGVKVIEDGRIAFISVEIARAEVGQVWVTGLPDRIELVTIGQGFVRDGDVVRTQQQPAEDREAALR